MELPAVDHGGGFIVGVARQVCAGREPTREHHLGRRASGALVAQTAQLLPEVLPAHSTAQREGEASVTRAAYARVMRVVYAWVMRVV